MEAEPIYGACDEQGCCAFLKCLAGEDYFQCLEASYYKAKAREKYVGDFSGQTGFRIAL